MTTVEMPCITIEIIPRWETSFVVIENWAGDSFVSDYRERKFICKLPKGLWIEAEVALSHLRN